jgi:subtilisin
MKQLVNTLLILAIFLIASCSPFRYLPDDKEVPETYREEFKQQKDQYKRILKEKNNWDVVLDPIEVIPTNEFSARGISGITNWGEQSLLQADVRERIRKECSHHVHVKIWDTASDYDHKDLKKGKIKGKSYTGDGTDIDVHGHSTHVAGIMAAQDFGLAWDLVDLGLMTYEPTEVLTDGGTGSFAWMTQDVKESRSEDTENISNGVSVIYSGSLGGGSTYGPLEAELKQSVEQGIFFNFASGNNGRYVEYPGKSAYTLATAAIGKDFKKASFSSPGVEVTATMPGVSIQSTYKNNAYASLSGTSMATPFETAAIAIALSKWGRKDLGTFSRLKKYLVWVATDIKPDGKDDATGWGVHYIKSILDNNPAQMEDDPQEPPTDPEPPKPEPVRPYPVSYTFDLSEDYKVMWHTGKGTKKNTLTVKEMRFKINDTKEPFPKLEKKVKEACDSFFKNRGMQLLPYHDQFDATYYAMRFLFMLRFKNIEADLVHVITEDQQSKAKIFRDDMIKELFESKYQSYIDVQTGQIKSYEVTKILKPISQDVSTFKIEN